MHKLLQDMRYALHTLLKKPGFALIAIATLALGIDAVLSGLALYTRHDMELSKDDKPERLAALGVTAGFFELLGVQPLLGREFRREDELPGNT